MNREVTSRRKSSNGGASITRRRAINRRARNRAARVPDMEVFCRTPLLFCSPGMSVCVYEDYYGIFRLSTKDLKLYFDKTLGVNVYCHFQVRLPRRKDEKIHIINLVVKIISYKIVDAVSSRTAQSSSDFTAYSFAGNIK